MHFFVKLLELGKLFFLTTSIHGLKHVVRDHIHWSERCVWLLFFSISLYGSIKLNCSTWNRYQQTPTVISIEKNHRGWSTSLPSITICPDRKYDSKKFKNYKNQDEIRQFLIYLSGASYHNFDEVPLDINSSIIPASKYLEITYEIRFNFNHIVRSSIAKWNNTRLDDIITEVGICYTYNNDISIYNSYKYWKSNNWSIVTTKAPMIGNPPSNGGELFFQIDEMNSAYDLFVHAAHETPDIATYAYHSAVQNLKILEMSAMSTYSIENVKYLSPSQRKCRFYYESNLASSPVYSYRSCRKECRLKLAFQLCGCVPFFYRQIGNYEICDIFGMQCLGQFKETIVKIRDPVTNVFLACSCFLTCDSTNYIVETNEDTFLNTSTASLKWTISRYPKVKLKYEILFGLSDVLVSVGGTFGLFLGSSVLSFLEIIYFCIIRLVLSFKPA